VKKTLRKLTRLMRNRRAVSPVIAVILLIAITVAAAVTVFAYTQGIIGGLNRPNLVLANAEIIDSLHIKLVWSNTGGSSLYVIQMDLEDDGAAVDTEQIYDAFTGELIDANGGAGFDTDLLVRPGESRSIIMTRESFSPTDIWEPGDIVSIQAWFTGNFDTSSPDYEADFQL